MDLKNKTVIVTGASRGIGLEIAKKLAFYGANVVCAATNQERCSQTAESLSKTYNIKALGVQVDVTNQESVQNLIDQTMTTFGAIDILVNNAGITRDNLLLRMKPEDWDAVIETNLKSIFLTTKSAIKHMLKNRSGKIINISSVVGIIGNPGQANYSASKAGMIGFTKSIAKEFGVKGITANVVAPGFIETDMIESLPKEYLDNIMSQIPLKRLGKAEEIANTVAFLASDLSNYITGEVIAVDGGIQL